MKKIIIPTGNKQQLACSIFYPEQIKKLNPAVLFIPGWTSSEASYHERAKALTDLEYICLAITLRGHGESSGELSGFSRADHIEDVLVAYDFLIQQKNVDPDNVSVVGASYGGYLAAILAGKRTIKHLALRAPALYENKQLTTPTAQLINDREEEFFKNLQVKDDNLALNGIKEIHGDLLLIESEKDQIIPSFIIGYFKSAADPKTTISHKIIHFSDHQLSKGEWKQEFIDLLVEFFQARILDEPFANA